MRLYFMFFASLDISAINYMIKLNKYVPKMLLGMFDTA